jgi:alkanesulfonate monooxygenase SsuD/methylene tetrahydromethanopterin reductase-like flavin-dependent oxidoreductase (luciferase family)
VSTKTIDFGIYVPQVGFGYAEIRDRALLAEELGFHSVWFMDHVYPPELPNVPSFEAWTLASAILATTSRLRVGHLVLSNTFRHPALLAKMATSLDVISGGRLELGIGSGSYAPEHERLGIEYGSARARSSELREALEIITAMFREPMTSFTGEHYRVRELPNLPPPAQRPRPPIHIGGGGEKFTLPLVARFADVWNCPTYSLGEFDRKREVLARECASIGRAVDEIRLSAEAVMVLVQKGADLDRASTLAEKRFGGAGWGLREGGYIGTPDDLIARIRENVTRGVTLFVFFTHDRAAPETLRLFAREVMPAFK